jgi:hypothetical protein
MQRDVRRTECRNAAGKQCEAIVALERHFILTFSQTEKELPLPEGEGWGEGRVGKLL